MRDLPRSHLFHDAQLSSFARHVDQHSQRSITQPPARTVTTSTRQATQLTPDAPAPMRLHLLIYGETNRHGSTAAFPTPSHRGSQVPSIGGGSSRRGSTVLSTLTTHGAFPPLAANVLTVVAHSNIPLQSPLPHHLKLRRARQPTVEARRSADDLLRPRRTQTPPTSAAIAQQPGQCRDSASASQFCAVPSPARLHGVKLDVLEQVEDAELLFADGGEGRVAELEGVLALPID